jgi:Tfp pilus assembly protein PilO
MKNNKLVLPPDIKVLLVPFLSLAVLFFVASFGIRIGFSEIAKQKEEIATVKKEITVLSDKEKLLKQVQSDYSQKIETFSQAIPEKNPVLAVLSQVKLSAQNKGLFVQKIKVGGGVPSKDLSTVDISLEITGPITGTIEYIDSLGKLAPIVTVQKIKLSQSGVTTASLNLRSYFAPFPTKLPTLTEPAKNLTADEKKIIEKMISLTPPLFLELVPTGITNRVDPF